ncbi:hypothetical protein BDK51DRAFT_49770 [Blyttiomyces helicus]|uniref:Uncharacterized protein n=1 Tax=Blyttiomyces helicus TaxID=388810 RepID=A0A4P9VX97_9FUNG|nr:hypothetical protein BDK51DRAFT_49770 [Blyttiomyces helicus]|eukprot:RKO83862.1 hypothetical protein BDK51DRAFT_49770 [Blyttiomyces helicus]
MTVKLIPNAIEIQTWKAKYMFVSFLHRDDSYTLLSKIWSTHIENGSLYRKLPDPSVSLACECHGLGTCEACYAALTAHGTRPMPAPFPRDEGERGRGLSRLLNLGGKTPPRCRSASSLNSDKSLAAPAAPAAEEDTSHGGGRNLAVPGSEGSAPPSPPPQADDAPPPSPVESVDLNPANCKCTHTIPKLFDKVYDIPLEQMWQLRFSDCYEGSWWVEFLQNRKFRDIAFSEWTASGVDPTTVPVAQITEGKRFNPSTDGVEVGQKRRFDYVMPLNAHIAVYRTRRDVDEVRQVGSPWAIGKAICSGVRISSRAPAPHSVQTSMALKLFPFPQQLTGPSELRRATETKPLAAPLAFLKNKHSAAHLKAFSSLQSPKFLSKPLTRKLIPKFLLAIGNACRRPRQSQTLAPLLLLLWTKW